MEHFLYIDESGDPANPIDENGNRKLRSSSIFSLGGIIVNEDQKRYFEIEHKKLIEKYFSGISLKSNFKLHYNPLRMYNSPYSDIGRRATLNLEQEIFNIIKNSGATLLSFSIDLEGHYRHYKKHVVNPLAYGLIVMLERLIYFMRDKDIDSTSVIYERFTNSLRDMVYKEQNYLRGSDFKTIIDLKKLFCYIHEGDPTKEPVLQFADFWTYLPYNKERSILQIKREFSQQYYNFNTDKKRGNVMIEYETGP